MKNLKIAGAVIFVVLLAVSCKNTKTEPKQTAQQQTEQAAAQQPAEEAPASDTAKASGKTRFGYINSLELTEKMPQVKKAKEQLEAQRKQAQKLLEEEGARYQQKYMKAIEDAQAGRLSEVDQKRVEQELMQMQQTLAQKEQSMTNDLLKKEEQLLKPIQDNIKKAISDVAKEKGYTFIFDASAGILLYSDESENVMSLVKAKLGIK